MPKVNIPKDFFCPLTLKLMQEPVIAADGHTYEKKAIQKYFLEENNISPKTGKKFKNNQLIFNHFAKNLISEFLERNSLCMPNEFIQALKTGKLQHVNKLFYTESLLKTVEKIMDEEGFTPLQFAAKSGHEDIVQFLLENGFCMNIKTNFGHGANPPLHLALWNNHETTARLLVAQNALIEQKGWNYKTPLHCTSNERMIRLLLEKKADINTPDGYGYVPLHQAAAEGNCSLTELLLEYKADINAKNCYQYAALEIAALENEASLVELLLARGATYDKTERVCPPYSAKEKLKAYKLIDYLHAQNKAKTLENQMKSKETVLLLPSRLELLKEDQKESKQLKASPVQKPKVEEHSKEEKGKSWPLLESRQWTYEKPFPETNHYGFWKTTHLKRVALAMAIGTMAYLNAEKLPECKVM